MLLYDETGKVGRYISEAIPSDIHAMLNPTKEKTIILECEYFDVCCGALDCWKNFVAGQHVTSLFNNSAVRYSLNS